MNTDTAMKIRQLGGLVPIGDSFMPASSSEVDAIEKRLGDRLPSAYREFVQTFGACALKEYVRFHPVELLPPSISSTGMGLFSCFFGAASAQHNSLAKKIDVFRNRIPRTMIPIGHDSGNLICLGISGSTKGRVYYWDQHGDLSENRNVHLVAHSFDDFISRLERWESE